MLASAPSRVGAVAPAGASAAIAAEANTPAAARDSARRHAHAAGKESFWGTGGLSLIGGSLSDARPAQKFATVRLSAHGTTRQGVGEACPAGAVWRARWWWCQLAWVRYAVRALCRKQGATARYGGPSLPSTQRR